MVFVSSPGLVTKFVETILSPWPKVLLKKYSNKKQLYKCDVSKMLNNNGKPAVSWAAASPIR